MGIYTKDGIIKVNPPLKSDIRIIRILIYCGLLSMFVFIYWFINPEHIGYAPVFWLLTFALLFKLLKIIHEWYHYWSPSIPVMPVSTKEWTVDILTTSCPGEPREMVIRTLRAMKAIRYPHTGYLCDEGNDPELKKVCDELGIIHVTRTIKIDAKAGNINNALTQATGEICIVLDPDHEPIPEFIDRVLPYFENPEIGFVQSVQAYGNQSESFIAKGAAEQTYHFYGPMMMCMNTYGTAQAIGANCAFRRSALDSIGGHAAGLSEDMHTAMQLHAKGWKSIYIPEILTRGLVPATLSSYYKQQLKWSRGTFELLFRTLPTLWKNFTWRQKIHYFTIPLYFLFGLINLIDILIPVLALGLAEVPWELNLARFASFFLPLCTISLIIRLFAQRWLLEKHERGLHFAGGILRMATWWIFLVGFVYTIFKIKVPYIPTPKEDEHQNYIKLSVPNIIMLLLSILLVVYGLSIDWTPYSIAMASYSVMTTCMLAFTVIVSQQKLLLSLSNFCHKVPALNLATHIVGTITTKSQQLVYHFLRNGVVVIIIAFSLVFLSYSSIEDENEHTSVYAPKELGGFYLGSELPQETNVADLKVIEKNIGARFNLISFTQQWSDSVKEIPMIKMNKIRNHGGLPFISWQANETGNTLFSEIKKGNCDNYLTKYAAFLKNYKDPVFITFTNTDENANISQEDYIRTWQYLYTFFNDLGISNITWVWCPKNIGEEKLYPGEKFVDWIGVTCLNYGEDQKQKDWYSFTDIYAPYRKAFGKFKKPVMINSFGSAAGEGQSRWISNALKDIKNNYPEVKSLVFFNGIKIFNVNNKSYTENFTLSSGSYLALQENLKYESFSRLNFNNSFSGFRKPHFAYKSTFIKGTPGNYQLIINNQPYYIRGVAYNTAHDWRDGNMPLTRRQLEKDFENIKAMGANTIRRYGMGVYDRNVLNIAEEFKLNVQYGFWFDPKIDYYSDSVKVQEYIEDVEEKVLRYKDHSSVIAWSLGNESWGLLKHRFAKPYLTKVRDAYIKMIEHLAQRIHEIDPTRPVFSCMEHEEYQLAGELVAFREGAPSLDVMGINSYYKEQITKLNHIAWQFDSLRPYLVSEFGPRGYWDPKYNRTSKGLLIEDSENEKANWYKEQWKNYVVSFKGYNIGGFAYCWHDRMEGSCTWFGLTDFKGRPKPSYFALKEIWTNEKTETLPQFQIETPASLSPGNESIYTAVTSTGINKELKYEWYLHKDGYLERIDNIDYIAEGKKVSVKIPKEVSNYRLYLYVSDKNGQVTTASVPVSVTKK